MKKLLLSLCLLPCMLFAESMEQVQVYYRANGGFVIVDANDEVLAYSDAGAVTTLPENMRLFFNDNQMDPQMTQKMAPAHIEAQLADAVKDSVGPLLGDIAFDQDVPYNNSVPVKIGGYPAPTGCVATAMAQIMAYYKYPKQCKGKVSYKTATLSYNVEFDFDNYKPDWDNILPTYKPGKYNATQAKAIADLMFACGAAVEMDYKKDAGSSYSELVPAAMASHFDYDLECEMIKKSDYTDPKYHDILQHELRKGSPIYYSSTQKEGSGHAYICDGYMIREGYEKYPDYHFNWGWGGSANAWVRLNKVAAKITVDGEVLDISFNQDAIINLHPKGWQDIEKVEATTTTDGAIYDILGRRVEVLSPGQMYIQNGQKFIMQ